MNHIREPLGLEPFALRSESVSGVYFILRASPRSSTFTSGIPTPFGLYLIGDRKLTLREIAEVQQVSVAAAQRRVQGALRILVAGLKEFDQ